GDREPWPRGCCSVGAVARVSRDRAARPRRGMQGARQMRSTRRGTMPLLTRWDPFEEVERLADRWFREPWGWGMRRGMLAPAVDVYETDEQVELRAELPGMKPEDVRIEITDHTI